jgi:hypothetical protein
MREMFADDVAAGGAEDIADEEDIHSKSLHGCGDRGLARIWTDKYERQRGGCGSFFAWHRAGGFN